MAKFQGYLGVTQRTVEVLSNNPTEELLQEMQKQMADLNFAWTIKEGEIRNFLENMKTITEVRKELTPKYQPIFIPTTGMPGMGGLNPLQ